MAPKRQELIEALIASPSEATMLASQLRRYPWDIDQPLATLRAADLWQVLSEFDGGEVSAEQVAGWADALEMRDDVALDPECEDLVRDVVFVLANPDLEGPLTAEKAAALMLQLAGCRR